MRVSQPVGAMGQTSQDPNIYSLPVRPGTITRPIQNMDQIASSFCFHLFALRIVPLATARVVLEALQSIPPTPGPLGGLGQEAPLWQSLPSLHSARACPG